MRWLPSYMFDSLVSCSHDDAPGLEPFGVWYVFKSCLTFIVYRYACCILYSREGFLGRSRLFIVATVVVDGKPPLPWFVPQQPLPATADGVIGELRSLFHGRKSLIGPGVFVVHVRLNFISFRSVRSSWYEVHKTMLDRGGPTAVVAEGRVPIDCVTCGFAGFVLFLCRR